MMAGLTLKAALTLILKATILLAVAHIAVRWRRRASASARHRVWAVSLVCLLILPVASMWMPTLPLPFLPAEEATPRAFTQTFDSADLLADEATPPTPTTRTATASEPLQDSQEPSWPALLITVYLGGVIVVLLQLALGLFRIRQLTRRAAPSDNGAWGAIVENQHLRRRVDLRLSEEIAVPMTWGAWRPVTLLPTDAEDWPQGHQRQALQHELAHIERWDWSTQLAARLTCALYWFHPWVWKAMRRLTLEAERASDDRVLLAGTSSSDYAEHLLSLARRLRTRPVRALAAVTMARRSQLPGRIETILDPQTRRTQMNRSRWIPLSLSTSLLTAAFAILLATAQLVPATPARNAELPEDAPTILEAAEAGDLETVRQELAAGAYPDQAARGFGTPLIVAATRGDEAMVRLLLDHGADVNHAETGRPRPTNLQRTALNAAARGGHAGIVGMLLDAGAEVDRVVAGDGTALIEAARSGSLKTTDRLLAAGAVVDRVVTGDGSALIAAAAGGHAEIVELLVAAGADPDRHVPGDGSPLIAAMKSGDRATIVALIEAGADPDLAVPGDGHPLLAAASRGDVEMIEELVAQGADVNAIAPGDGNALIAAVRGGDQETVETLLTAGARADAGIPGDGNALIAAAARGQVEMVRRMVATGADVNKGVRGDGSPLIAASRAGRLEVVQLLVDSGADVDQVVRGDENPLIQASWAGHLDVVEYLIEQGADVNARVKADRREIRTPLRQARLGGHDDVADVLIAAGAVD